MAINQYDQELDNKTNLKKSKNKDEDFATPKTLPEAKKWRATEEEQQGKSEQQMHADEKESLKKPQ